MQHHQANFNRAMGMSDIMCRAPDAPEPPGRELQQLPLLDPVRARVSGLLALDRRRQNTLLLVASYVFYGAWDYRFLFLILLSTVIDFIGGLGVAGVGLPARKRRNLGVLLIGSSILLTSGIRYDLLFAGDVAAALPLHARDWAIPLATLFATVAYGVFLPRLYRLPTEQRRKVFLVISMVANLAILGFFKYCDFFVDSVTAPARHARAGTPSWPTLNLILPAGISFYTFQAMSYTIDVYRGEIEPTAGLRRLRAVRLVLPAPGRRADHAGAHAAAAGAASRAIRADRGHATRALILILWRPVQEGGDRRQPGADRERGVLPFARGTRRG